MAIWRRGCHWGLSLHLLEKDFRARLVNGRVAEIGVRLKGSDAIPFQTLYRLSAGTTTALVAVVERFVTCGEISVYAENALEPLLPLEICGLGYSAQRPDSTAGPERIDGPTKHSFTRWTCRRI